MKWLFDLWWSLVRFGFRLLYHELAWTYDFVSRLVSFGAWHDWQRSAIEFLPAPAAGWLLDLAHGTAVLHEALLGSGHHCIGLDFSRQMGRIALHRLSTRGLPVRLVQGSGLTLPFASRSFAAVLSTFPTGFIFEQATLNEIARVLQPGAPLVIVLGAALPGSGILVRFVEWLYRITGQREGLPPAVMARFESAGLTAQLERRTVRGSTVALIVAYHGEARVP